MCCIGFDAGLLTVRVFPACAARRIKPPAYGGTFICAAGCDPTYISLVCRSLGVVCPVPWSAYKERRSNPAPTGLRDANRLRRSSSRTGRRKRAGSRHDNVTTRDCPACFCEGAGPGTDNAARRRLPGRFLGTEGLGDTMSYTLSVYRAIFPTPSVQNTHKPKRPAHTRGVYSNKYYLDEERGQGQRQRRQKLDQYVQRRAGSVLERIANRVARNCRLVSW